MLTSAPSSVIPTRITPIFPLRLPQSAAQNPPPESRSRRVLATGSSGRAAVSGSGPVIAI